MILTSPKKQRSKNELKNKKKKGPFKAEKKLLKKRKNK